MTEALLLKVLDAGLFAFSVGVERKTISDEVRKLADTPEHIPAALAKMTADMLAKLDEVTK